MVFLGLCYVYWADNPAAAGELSMQLQLLQARTEGGYYRSVAVADQLKRTLVQGHPRAIFVSIPVATPRYEPNNPLYRTLF